MGYFLGDDISAFNGNELPEIVSESEIEFFGIKIKVYVLDNGKRVIDQESFDRLLEKL